MNEAETPLNADEITNFKEISREYFPDMRTAEYVFSCDVRGEPDVLTYELSQHDDGERYWLHTQKHDIWDRMSRKELDKLEFTVSREVTFADWEKEIEQADSTDALWEVQCGMWETEHLNLSDEQRERLYQMMDEKKKSFPDSQRDGQNPDQAEKTAPPTVPQEEKVTVAFYYVDSDPYGDMTERVYQEFPDVKSALSAYDEIPNHFNRELGMKSTEKPPSRMALVQCRNGIDTMYDIEAASPSGKWDTPEIWETYYRAQFYLDNYDFQIAYRMEAESGYFAIQNVEGGFTYQIYDASFCEVCNGIYENTDVSTEEAVEAILSETDFSSCSAHRKVMDYGEFLNKVRAAEQEVNLKETEKQKSKKAKKKREETER